MYSDQSRRFVPVLLLFVALISCSVKEDRSDCPSVLTLDLREALKKVPPELLPFRITVYNGHYDASSDMGSDNTFLLKEAVTDSSFWQCSVQRGALLVRVAAIGNKDLPLSGSLNGNAILTDNGLYIPEGNDCPSIYWSIDQIGDPQEAVTIVPHLKKDFCRLSVSFVGIPSNVIPYSVRFIGNITGYDALLRPSSGPFNYLCQEGESGTYTIRLPRQTDGSLRMDIISGETLVKSFAIGNYIESSGYDWTSEDLEDLDLEINFAATTITLRTSEWTVISYFEVMI